MILFSNLSLGLDYVIMALAPSVRWLLVGRVLSGICSASFSIPGAYIADVTPKEKRAASFGMLGAAFGLGFVVGPAFGGVLGHVDPRLPFWVAAGLSLANFLYGFFILPESLPPERRAPLEWRKANPIGALQMLRQHPEVFGIAGVVFLSALAHEALPSLWVLYTDYRFGWDTRTVGLTLGRRRRVQCGRAGGSRGRDRQAPRRTLHAPARPALRRGRFCCERPRRQRAGFSARGSRLSRSGASRAPRPRR